MTALDDLVREARALRDQMAAMERPKAKKLTAEAFVTAAEAQARVSPKHVGNLLNALRDAGTEADGVRAALRRMVAHCRDPNVTRPHTKVRHLMTDEAEAELAALGSNRLKLFALAAHIATRDHAGDFGTCRDADKHWAEFERLKARRAAALAAMPAAVTGADIALDRDGAFFRCAPSVRLRLGFAEDLVNYAPAQAAAA